MKRQTLFKLLFIGLLALVCILLVVDIYRGSFYGNRFNFKFDHVMFSNIITPIAAVISILFYSAALRTTRHQNQIILSQNLKPYYEDKIVKLVAKGETTYIYQEAGQNFSEKQRDAFHYTQLIRGAMFRLITSKDYPEDWEKITNGEALREDYFKQRDYYSILSFLYPFAVGFSPMTFFYDEIKLLISEINSSPLIAEDKKILKQRIKTELLAEYMLTIQYSSIDAYTKRDLPIYINKPKAELLTESKFLYRGHYDWFKNQFEEE